VVAETRAGNGVGASLLRKEDARHLAGRGQFVSDLKVPGTIEVAFLRSPHANARIKSISVPPEAQGHVFTAADLPRVQPIRIATNAPGAKSPLWPPLATDRVRYVGDAIAACLAPTRGEAEDLAAEIIVEYEVLEATAHDWLADEFARGTWAIHRPGWYEHHHAAMRRPEGRLLLAGSDLANGWSGFIDGAIESGLRAGAWAAATA